MSKNSFNLLSHIGNTVYQSKIPNVQIEALNSFCLFNKTISSVLTQKLNIQNYVDFENMKKFDQLNNEKPKFNNIKENDPFYLKREIFIQDSFFNNLLSKEKNFGNMYRDIEFKMLESEDKKNSSFFHYIKIIKNLKKLGELNKVEENMRKKMGKLGEYEKENYSLISDEFECEGKNKYYRRVKANGNSFYISFIYQYMKRLILGNEESIIAEIFYIMDKYLNVSNQINKNIQQDQKKDNDNENNLGEMYIYNSLKNSELNSNFIPIYALFSLLYNNLEEKKIDEAEKILDYGFIYEEGFANFFCLYMRIQIKNFITINKDIFTYEKFCKETNLIEEKYYNKGIFICDKYFSNNLLVNQKEPTLFIISLVPYVFNICMDLYINEKKYSFNKISFKLKEKIDNTEIIQILYSSFSYHIIENNSNFRNSKIKNIDSANTLNTQQNFKDFKIDKYVDIINDEKKCNSCHESKFILLKYISKNPVCLKCLKQTINEILIKRYKKMINERFKYLEFYLRDIPINERGNNNFIFLSPPEFYCIFGNTIYNHFRYLIEKLCVNCLKYDNFLIRKKCGCLICLKDARHSVKEIPILYFEKNKMFKDEKVECICGKSNDYVELALSIYDKLDENEKNKIKESAEERFDIYIKNYCMSCEIDLKTDSIGNDKKKYEIMNFGPKTKKHLICEECFSHNHQNILCKICGDVHEKENNDEHKNNPNKNIQKNKENENNIKEPIKSNGNDLKKNKNKNININIISNSKSESKKESNYDKNVINNNNSKTDHIKDQDSSVKNDSRNKMKDDSCCIIY